MLCQALYLRLLNMTNIHALVRKQNLMRYPNVVGYSAQLMPRIRRGRVIHEERCIRVYVSRKMPEHLLRPSDVIPKSLKLDDGREVCTDVVEIGKIKKMQTQLDPKIKWRPSPAGVSTGRADEVSAGTFGWFVVTEDGDVYAMSNNHVWAKENQGSRGDPIVQPGRLDGGDPERDVIMQLYDFVPISFTDQNTVDVAVASVNTFGDVYMSILNVGGITGKRVPSIGEKVRKMGRSTGLTEGTIIDNNASINVEYDSGVAMFTDVVVVEGTDIVSAGDSGSPVLASDNSFVGLLFAGNDAGSVFIVCKYTNIESALTQRIGKKTWILISNSYPPFFREVQIQTVYRDSAVLAMLLIPAFIVFPIVETVRAIGEAYRKT